MALHLSKQTANLILFHMDVHTKTKENNKLTEKDINLQPFRKDRELCYVLGLTLMQTIEKYVRSYSHISYVIFLYRSF